MLDLCTLNVTHYCFVNITVTDGVLVWPRKQLIPSNQLRRNTKATIDTFISRITRIQRVHIYELIDNPVIR